MLFITPLAQVGCRSAGVAIRDINSQNFQIFIKRFAEFALGNDDAAALLKFPLKEAKQQGRVGGAQQFYADSIGQVKGQLIVIHAFIVAQWASN